MTGQGPSVRVLQVHNRYRQPGGEDRLVDSHRSLLEQQGYQVETLEFINPEDRLSALSSLALAPWNSQSATRVESVLSSWQPSIAHVHNTWFTASPSVVGALSNAHVPTVMTLHNYRLTCVNAQLLRNGGPCEDCVGASPWQGVQHRCYRRSFVASAAAAATISLNRKKTTWRGVDRFLVFTEFQKRIMSRAGLEPKQMDVVPNFAEDPGRRIQRASASDFVLFVGRLSSEKGIDRIVDAWDAVRPSGLRLVVLGDGPLKPMLDARRVPGVELRGSVGRESVREAMLGARALVFPSIWYEGQPLVLLEALAASLPIVAPRIGGIPDTIGEAAIWIDADWETTLGRLEEMDDRTLNDMSKLARERYESTFTTTEAVSNLTRVYHEVLGEAA